MQAYTIGQAARLLGVRPDTARRWANAGRMAPHRDEGGAFGIVTAIKVGDVAAQVEIRAGLHRLVSPLPREAVEELGLDVGMEASSRVKSTNVHIDRV
ncbi:MerR family DNA-binding transcriptional regulator [Streptomyces sp. NPDC004562]|uniref:MerR family DNA-binding transcriptional regulator n=1 Tax=Streptomyces sp. NPDC004562 TaxID=3364703 RepID=UPI0036C489D9